MQGMDGCAENRWRFNLDGYLREVLTARVYDVAVSDCQCLPSALCHVNLWREEVMQTTHLCMYMHLSSPFGLIARITAVKRFSVMKDSTSPP